MAEVGLAGLEVYHRDHDDVARAQACVLLRIWGWELAVQATITGLVNLIV